MSTGMKTDEEDEGFGLHFLAMLRPKWTYAHTRYGCVPKSMDSPTD